MNRPTIAEAPSTLRTPGWADYALLDNDFNMQGASLAVEVAEPAVQIDRVAEATTAGAGLAETLRRREFVMVDPLLAGASVGEGRMLNAQLSSLNIQGGKGRTFNFQRPTSNVEMKSMRRAVRQVKAHSATGLVAWDDFPLFA